MKLKHLLLAGTVAPGLAILLPLAPLVPLSADIAQAQQPVSQDPRVKKPPAKPVPTAKPPAGMSASTAESIRPRIPFFPEPFHRCLKKAFRSRVSRA